MVEEETDSEEDAFLETVGEGHGNPCLVKARLNGVFMEFQIDTGTRLRKTNTNNPAACQRPHRGPSGDLL